MNITQLKTFCKKHPEEWSFEDVGNWLKQIHLDEYVEIFNKSKIDGTMLCLLTEEDIQVGLNIQNFMHRKRLITAIQVLQLYDKKEIKNVKELEVNKVQKNPVENNPFVKDSGKDSKMEIEYLSEVQNDDNGNNPFDYTGYEASESSMIVSKKLFNQGTTQNPFINNHGHMQSNNNLFLQSKQLLKDQFIQSKNENTMHPMQNPFINKENQPQDLSQMVNNIIVPGLDESQSKMFKSIKINNSKLNDTQMEEEEEEQKEQEEEKEEEGSPKTNSENPNTPGDVEQKELVLQPIEGSYKYIFYVADHDTTIGRHSSNKLVICDESVSRYHCKIIHNNNEFKIQDVGSTTGTYLKIKKKFTLKPGITIEMGSNQFLLEKQTIMSDTEGQIIFRLTEGEEQHMNRTFTIDNKGSIGRKPDSSICFEDDVHLSNLHAVFSMCNGKFVFEDMSSTNGSWMRLSNEGKKSMLFPLKHKDEIKIGLQCTFKAKIKTKNKSKELLNIDTPSEQLFENNRCDICYEKEKNALLLPCKHNCTCILCAKNLTQCPICRSKITDFIKIYKS